MVPIKEAKTLQELNLMDRFLFAEAEDENDVICDAEPQQKDTRNLPKRSRYYQSLIDSSLLKPGTVNYNQLNDVYLIMIMSFDLFGKNRYQYTFRMTCQQEPDVTPQDGVVKIFLNTRGENNGNVSQELVDTLKYFECTTDEEIENL